MATAPDAINKPVSQPVADPETIMVGGTLRGVEFFSKPNNSSEPKLFRVFIFGLNGSVNRIKKTYSVWFSVNILLFWLNRHIILLFI